jgi:cholinesterase
MRRLCILAYSLCVVAAPNARYQQIFVFGDSYSDNGAGYVDGNGPTAVAYLATHMGLKLLPANDASEGKGRSLNFAVSGAQTGRGEGRRVDSSARLGYGMLNQVDDFAAMARKKEIAFDPKTTLFFLAGGLNDRRLASDTTFANLISQIRTLHSHGGRNFVIARLPEAIPEFSEVGKRLNPVLETIPAAVRKEFLDVAIRMSNWGRFMDEVRNNPGGFGIANVTKACAGRAIFREDATPCEKPDTYFYYHSGHPSTAVHKIVGAKLFDELNPTAGSR